MLNEELRCKLAEVSDLIKKNWDRSVEPVSVFRECINDEKVDELGQLLILGMSTRIALEEREQVRKMSRDM